MRCLERDPDRRPQTMGALEYELTKSMKGRGSAVAAVLGLKPSEEVMQSTWGEESSKPRLFDTGAIQGRRGSMPSIPVQRTGTTGAVPLAADEDRIRVNTDLAATRNAPTQTATLDERLNAELRARAREQGRGARRVALLALLAAVGAGGVYAYNRFVEKPAVEKPPVVVADDKQPDKQPEPAKPTKAAKGTKTAKTPRDDDKMSPAEIDRMLEWARRTAEGGRILAPPGDNLKELLDRIDKADPGNPQAEALKNKTTTMLGRKGTLALKKGRLDEAAEDFDALVGLKPDDEWSKGRLARALTLRAQRSLGRNKFQAALADATAALEFAPEDTNIQLTLGDVHLAMGKRELAAEEFQRVLDVKPQDARAKLGLQRATAPKKAPPKKRKGRGR